jgi:hypothetical protein
VARLGGRPLLDTTPDQELYVARPTVEEQLLSALRRDLNALVLGPRGSGKTTLLRHLQFGLRASGARGIFVEGATPADLRGFVELVRHRVRAGGAELPPPARAEEPLVELLEGLAPRDEVDAGWILLVDSMPSPADAHTLFGRLRDEIWRLPYTWIVAAEEEDRSVYLTPPADAFFDVVCSLPPLEPAEQLELLSGRLADETIAASELVGATGNPRELVALARAALRFERAPADLLRARAAHERSVRRLGRAAEMLLGELEAAGPASASDQRLLRRLGWTRERAAQVFKLLEREGMVTSSLEKGRAGRPRKVYEVVGWRTP